MSSLPKPVLRGHIRRRGLRGIIGAVTFAAINGCLFNFLYREPKIRRHDKFLETYDADAHSMDLINWGYFQTIRPEDIKKEED